jgi:hypothetical protein
MPNGLTDEPGEKLYPEYALVSILGRWGTYESFYFPFYESRIKYPLIEVVCQVSDVNPALRGIGFPVTHARVRLLD